MNPAPDPAQIEALLQEAARRRQAGDFEGVVAALARLTALAPHHALAHSELGAALWRLGRGPEALDSLGRALAIDPRQGAALVSRGNVLRGLGQPDEALASFDRALALNDGDLYSHFNRANALTDLGRLDEAVASLDRVIALRPDLADAHANRGNILHELGRTEEALASLDRALAFNPNLAGAHDSRGVVLLNLAQPAEALASAERALAIWPDYANAHNNRGNALRQLGRLAEAAEAFRAATRAGPDHARAQGNLGQALQDLGLLEGAVQAFAAALAADPVCPDIAASLVVAQRRLCAWGEEDRTLLDIAERIGRGEPVCSPFWATNLFDDPGLLRRCAEIDAMGRKGASPIPAPAPASGGKIRLGYFSADFHAHATMHLLAELLEAHDRERFELYAFGFGPAHDDEWTVRARRAFDRFIDVRALSDDQAVHLARQAGIDIAIDLKGLTRDARPGIFARRAAPVQASYLGYPGTSGITAMDYIIADAVVIPPGDERFYTEQVVRLPGSYQANCRNRTIADGPVSRAAFGLPQHGFVFASFNATAKISGAMFARWMGILRRTPGSVLWLFVEHPDARDNARAAAASAGVEAERLVFAERLAPEHHLARLPLADLLLDTAPYNGHTTTSDALRMGTPVLTLAGGSFAARVAASLLTAVGGQALIAETAQGYEDLAVALAQDPARLKAARRLAAAAANSALFDADASARNLERAYAEIHRRRLAGLPPAPLDL